MAELTYQIGNTTIFLNDGTSYQQFKLMKSNGMITINLKDGCYQLMDLDFQSVQQRLLEVAEAIMTVKRSDNKKCLIFWLSKGTSLVMVMKFRDGNVKIIIFMEQTETKKMYAVVVSLELWSRIVNSLFELQYPFPNQISFNVYRA